jgi:hypothetical protein
MFGVFGDTLEQAKRSEFFVWFHLRETGSTTDGDRTAHTFRPTAPQFHDLVGVQLVTNAQEKLLSCGLMIQRAFIDQADQSTFAADITKSFLVASLGEKDLALVADAAMQIRAYEASGSNMVRMNLRGNAPEPLAPGEGELEYQTYAGKRRSYERTLIESKLVMANESVDGVEQLRIVITPP